MVRGSGFAGVLLPIRRFLANTRGVGAIEFALVAPVLLILYIGAAEISVAMSINRKVARAASTIADLVTQETSVDKAALANMKKVADAVMVPYAESPVSIKISEIAIDGSGKATVQWSWADDATRPYGQNSATTVPSDLVIPSTYLVRAELSYQHKLLLMVPGADSLQANTLTLAKTYYLRPRSGDAIKCTDC